MNWLRYIVCCFLLLYAFGFASAQIDTLSSSEAVSKALENNYGIVISKAELDIAGINNNWGTAGRFPTIGFDASANNNYSISNEVLTDRLYTSLGMNWIIFDGFRVNITKEKLATLEIASEGALAVTIESTVEDIILGYYRVLLEQERLKVLNTVMGLSRDRYDYELARQQLGGSVTYNVLQAQNVYLNDKSNVMNQEVILRNSVRNLNFLMGEDPVSEWYFSESFVADTSQYSLDDLLGKMKSNNQILQNQYTNLLLKQNDILLKQSDYYPSISLSTGVENTYTSTYNSANGTSNVNNLAPFGNIRLSWDIYAAGNRRRADEIARINQDIAQLNTDRIEHLLTNELFNLYDFYQVRIELLNVADEGLAAAELNMSIAEDKYRSGVINSFNFRDIQLIYLNAALQRLQSVYNLIESNARMTRITGGFLNVVPE